MLRRKSRPMETSFNLILQHGVILKHSLCPYWGIWSQHYHPWRYTMKLFFLPSDLTKAPITCHTIPIIVTLLAVTGLTHGVCSKNHGIRNHGILHNSLVKPWVQPVVPRELMRPYHSSSDSESLWTCFRPTFVWQIASITSVISTTSLLPQFPKHRVDHILDVERQLQVKCISCQPWENMCSTAVDVANWGD